jgi:hypothetical protein
MKWNWGTNLFIGAALFVVFIIFLVVSMMRQEVDLVEKNYYESGLAYENELEKFKRTEGLDHKFFYHDSLEQLVFTSAMGGNIHGIAYFYRPNESAKDYEMPFMLDEFGSCTIPTQAMHQGRWKVKFEWVLNGDTLATSHDFYIQ